MRLNEWGKIVHEVWFESTGVRQEIKLDRFVVMPNHLHGVVFINQDNTAGATRRSVGATGAGRPYLKYDAFRLDPQNGRSDRWLVALNQL